MTRCNFGALRDPEMLHKIYNAEPVASIIEIPHRVTQALILYTLNFIFISNN